MDLLCDFVDWSKFLIVPLVVIGTVCIDIINGKHAYCNNLSDDARSLLKWASFHLVVKIVGLLVNAHNRNDVFGIIVRAN